MRILMTTDTVGGVWTYTRELVSGLLEEHADFSLGLVTFGGTVSAEQQAWLGATRAAFGKRFTYEVTTLPLEWQRDNTKAYIYAEPLLRRIAKGFAPDLFHSNQFCFGALPLTCPKVVVAHSDVLSWLTAVRGPDAVADADTPWLDQYRTLVTNGLNGATTIVAPTHAMLHDLEAGFGPQPGARVIANGCSVPVPRIEKKLQAVTAGRVWDRAKGMAVLEDLLCSMPVFVAGETAHPDGSYDAERLRRRTLLGALTQQQLLHTFAESAIYLVTSIYEPFGLSAVEAAQCGCAVIARDIPSQREVWGDAAMYFHDAHTLCEALNACARTPERLHAAQAEATLRVRQHFLRDHMVAAYTDLYRTVLAAQGASSRQEEHPPAA